MKRVVFALIISFWMLGLSPSGAFAFNEYVMFKEDADIVSFTRRLIHQDLLKKMQSQEGEKYTWSKQKMVRQNNRPFPSISVANEIDQ